jgi:hypothetical protein
MKEYNVLQEVRQLVIGETTKSKTCMENIRPPEKCIPQ